jgi:predicted nucleic-acid-binding Zn-ribbon protein
MKDGHCPMCKSTEIYKNGTLSFRASGQSLELENEDGDDKLGFEFAPYICLNCGFAALYVDFPDDLSVLRKTKGWEKVE